MALAIGSTLTPFSLSHAQVKGVNPAPGMPEPSMVPTNGINMAVYEQGSGPAVIFCHGFPELAYSWRNQLGAIADAGYHAIAPDQRGFGMTGGPQDSMQYDISIFCFCDDVVGMMDAKGMDQTVFVGHDRGGAVALASSGSTRLRPDPQTCHLVMTPNLMILL